MCVLDVVYLFYIALLSNVCGRQEYSGVATSHLKHESVTFFYHPPNTILHTRMPSSRLTSDPPMFDSLAAD